MTAVPRRETAGCSAAIVFALVLEASAFERRVVPPVVRRGSLPVVRLGTVAGRRVAWCIAGAGAEAAARAARLLAAGQRPRILVSAGFAGALDGRCERGSPALATLALCPRGAAPLPLWGPGVGMAAGAPPNGPGPLAIVSVDHVVYSAAEKRSLACDTRAQLVDMETFAVAAAARDLGLPCASLRVVSDDARQELPEEVGRLLQPRSSLRRAGEAIVAVARRPRLAVELWRLRENALVDAMALAAALTSLIAELEASDDDLPGAGSLGE